MTFSPLNRNKKSKYNAIPVVIDGRRFASRREGARYIALQALEREGVIRDLECQPRYSIAFDGVKICTYVADFRYVQDGKTIVEDVKGVRTSVYKLKSKLMLALHKVAITEI
jgi:hypothetical protein